MKRFTTQSANHLEIVQHFRLEAKIFSCLIFLIYSLL